MNFLLTKFMYPIKEKLEILDGYYFDNPRNKEEIDYISNIISKSTPFPPNDKMAGAEGYITLDYILKQFSEKYDDDLYVEDYLNKSKYKNSCKKAASMWVILRLKETSNSYESEKIISKAKNYIDILTLLTFNVTNYLEYSVIASQEYYQTDESTLYHQIENSFLEIVVEAINIDRKKSKLEEYRFNGFMFYYNKIILLDQKIKKFDDRETIDYIAECFQCFRSNNDLKMKYVSIISIIELLLTHCPDPTKFNVEDSISKQFKNKIALIVYLTKKELNTDNIINECDIFYSLRSDIAHGNYKQLEKDLKKYYDFCKENKLISIENYDKTYTMDKIIIRSLEYMIIILNCFIDDRHLLVLMKKI